MSATLADRDAAFWPQPGELWSLLDMFKIKADAFVYAVQLIQRHMTLLGEEETPQWKTPLDEPFRARSIEFLDEIDGYCDALGAKITKIASNDLRRNCLGDGFESKTLKDWVDGLREVISTLFREMRGVHLYAIDPALAHHLEDDRPPPFGEEVFDKFQDAHRDLLAAGHCLATDSNTAAVFHLMRAMEVAVQAFSVKLGVDLREANGRIKPWGGLLGEIQSKLKALDKGAAETTAFWRVHADLSAANHAWRSPTNHPALSLADHYDATEAEEIYRASKTFMRHVAKLV